MSLPYNYFDILQNVIASNALQFVSNYMLMLPSKFSLKGTVFFFFCLLLFFSGQIAFKVYCLHTVVKACNVLDLVH